MVHGAASDYSHKDSKMGSKNKLKRFNEVADLPNVTEYTDFDGYFEHRGNWAENVFGNNNPIVLELACGKGEYSLALAGQYPGKNVIGVDIKGARIWVGANTAREQGLENVQFIRAYIDHLDRFFGENEVSEIWITFPDPYPRKSKKRKRLTSPKFLKLYRTFAVKNCRIHLKTDSELLWEFTKETIAEEKLKVQDIVENVYKERKNDLLLTIQTYFEKMHLEAGRQIRYICFDLNPK